MNGNADVWLGRACIAAVLLVPLLFCGGCRVECDVHHSSKATPTASR